MLNVAGLYIELLLMNRKKTVRLDINATVINQDGVWIVRMQQLLPLYHLSTLLKLMEITSVCRALPEFSGTGR